MASRSNLSSSYCASVRTGRGIPTSLAGIRPGDVVVYRRPDRQNSSDELVHRIAAATSDGLVARGDSKLYAGGPLLTADNLLGQAAHVERRGKTHLVAGGRCGLPRARVHQALHSDWRSIKKLGQKSHRWLGAHGLIPRCWWPSVKNIHLPAENGLLVNYACGGRTVARWWTAEGKFECQRPYDLVFAAPDDGSQMK